MASTPYTVLNLIKRSMRLLGVLEVGSNPTADEEQDGLEALNAMVDAWALLRLMIYASVRQVFALNANQASYEIGPHAVDWVAQRPVFLDGAGFLYGVSGQQYERPVQIYTPDEWQNQRAKSLSTSVTTSLIYDYGFSNQNSSASADVGSGNVFVWPLPSVSGLIALYLPQAVSEFTSVNQTIALPPGYRRALAYNLAIESASEYDAEPSDVVVAIAATTLESIQRANVKLNALRCDAAVARHTRGGGYDIRMDQ